MLSQGVQHCHRRRRVIVVWLRLWRGIYIVGWRGGGGAFSHGFCYLLPFQIVVMDLITEAAVWLEWMGSYWWVVGGCLTSLFLLPDRWKAIVATDLKYRDTFGYPLACEY